MQKVEAAVQDILTELYSKMITLCRQDNDSTNQHGTAESPAPTKGRRGKRKGGGDRCVMFPVFFSLFFLSIILVSVISNAHGLDWYLLRFMPNGCLLSGSADGFLLCGRYCAADEGPGYRWE